MFVIINLPFSLDELSLNFEDLSPTFASIEVSNELVSNLVTDLSICEQKSIYESIDDSEKHEYDIFVRRNDKYIISSRNVQNIFSLAISNLNRLNSSGGSSNGGPVETLEFSPRFYHDVFHGYGHKCPDCYSSSSMDGSERYNESNCSLI